MRQRSPSTESLIQAEKLISYVQRGGDVRLLWESKDFSLAAGLEIRRALEVIMDENSSHRDQIRSIISHLTDELPDLDGGGRS